MSLIDGHSSQTPLQPDGHSHISTLASSSTTIDPIVWKKSTPLKTYSKKKSSPASPLLVTVSKYLETETGHKSRYGRSRKLIPSGDFLSTDRKVSRYLEIQTENQFHNFRATYSNYKVRSIPKKLEVPCKTAPVNSSGSFSMNFLSKSEVDGDVPRMSILDLAAPTCSETVETPLPLQECESDSDSDSMTPQDYSVGDLVWAAVPKYPYWPAMITRDPISSLPYRIQGTGRRLKVFWHVHFFGDKGMRAWVITRNTFVFDGLDSYNNAKVKYLSSIAQLGKKQQKILKKAYTIPDHYGKSWVAAVSEAHSLLPSTRSDRLEYLISTYAPKIETSKKRQRALSLCDLNMITKKPRMSEPPQRRKSLITKAPRTALASSVAELEMGNTVIGAIPTVVPVSTLKELPILPSIESNVPYTPSVDPIGISPNSALVSPGEKPHRPPATCSPVTPKRSIRKSKSVESNSAQKRPVENGLPAEVVESRNILREQHEIRTEEELGQDIRVKPVQPQAVEDSSIVSLEGVSSLLPSVKEKRKRGRPRKYPVTEKGQLVGKSLDTIIPKKVPPKKTSLPVQSVSASSEKRTRGRPKKTSLPTPTTGKCENVTKTPERTKSQAHSSNPEPSPTITRSGRQSNKPVMLATFTSPKVHKQEPKTKYCSSTPVSFIKQEPASLHKIKIEPESPSTTPKTKRKTPYQNGKKKKVKLEPDIDSPVGESLVKEEPSSPTDPSKPNMKVEIASNVPNREYQRIQQTKKTSLFAGVKDGKVCSICFKGGPPLVRRCRGPCSLYMHEECSTKPRFVVDQDLALDGPKRSKKKSRRQLMVELKKTSLESSNEQDKASSANGVCSVEINPPSENSTSSSAEYDVNKVEVIIGDDDSMENRIKVNSGLLNGPTSCEHLLQNHTNIVDNSESCLNKVCRFNEKTTNENNIEEEELIIHMTEQESFPESSGIPTPPPEDNSKSPKPNDASLISLNLEHVKEELAIPIIKADSGSFPLDSSESMTSDASEKEKNDASRKEAKDKGWVCNMCQEGNLGPCFACGKDDGDRVRCKASGMCGKVFHLDCTKEWPQHTKKHTATGKLIFNCPAHTCHTCISDNPASLTSRYLNDKLVRCVRCPTTYHHGNFCVPAGSEILSSTQIICPRHFRQGKKSLSPVNASWCFLCSMGGSLICCDLCPNSFHVECLKISPPEGAYICEDCETGRFPLYGEIVWAKLGNYRWWPARILFPLEIPASLQRVEHVPGEFVVRFYGTYNYYWLHRGRVFLFHEGDGSKQESISLHSKKHSEGVFNRGVEEANSDFIIWTSERNRREETQRTSLKPPKYVKITSNRPVGSVKMNEADSSSITACYCKPDQEDPCGPESDCINRLLLVECSTKICPAGEKCNNQNFEKRLYPPLAPFRTDYRGWGLKTLGPLKKGDFIIEYVGEMIDEDEYKRRLLEMQRSKDENFYFLTLDKDRMLDAGPKGNLSRFMNHSCQPNCETQKWTVEGNMRVGLFALQDIPAGSELVFNYNLMTTGASKLECRCGAPNCASFIGGKPNKPPTKSKDVSINNSVGPLKQKGKKKAKTRRRKSLAKVALKNSSEIVASTKATPAKDDIKCFACHEVGATVACQDARCPQLYHLACLGLTKNPSKRWTCPWHECSVCGSRNKVENCSLCINAYCGEHQEGNIVFNRGKGSLCHNHNMSDSGSEWSTGEKDEENAEGGNRSSC